MDLKNVQRGRLGACPKVSRRARHHVGKRPRAVPAQLTFPRAARNGRTSEDARTLLANGCIGVSEGTSMPSELTAIDASLKLKVLSTVPS